MIFEKREKKNLQQHSEHIVDWYTWGAKVGAPYHCRWCRLIALKISKVHHIFGNASL